MNEGFMETARGIVIRQSMVGETLPDVLMQFVVGETLPDVLMQFVVDKHTHLLGGTELVDVLVLQCSDYELLPLLTVVAQQIKPNRYYAHFIYGSIMYVVFPLCIVLVSRNDKITAQQARVIGSIFGIPAEQMKFEQLFEVDHPDVST
jgi:hypothetical protein